MEHVPTEKTAAVASYNGLSTHFFPGLAHCHSARWKGEVEMWGIINRVWQAASSERSLLIVDWQVDCEGHTCAASVFSLELVSLGLTIIFLKIWGVAWKRLSTVTQRSPVHVTRKKEMLNPAKLSAPYTCSKHSPVLCPISSSAVVAAACCRERKKNKSEGERPLSISLCRIRSPACIMFYLLATSHNSSLSRSVISIAPIAQSNKSVREKQIRTLHCRQTLL